VACMVRIAHSVCEAAERDGYPLSLAELCADGTVSGRGMMSATVSENQES
jgi:hypothetical protein